MAYLTSAVTFEPLPQPLAVIIEKIRPLLLDGSQPVRQQLNKLLRALPAEGVPNNVGSLILHIRAALTHLSNDVRMTALEAFEWLLVAAGEEAVGAAGAWVKTLKCFLSLLGWQQHQESKDVVSKWSTVKQARARPAGGDKLFVKQLQTFALFLDIGLGNKKQRGLEQQPNTFPLWHTQYHMLSTRSNPYGFLNLFGAPRDEESEAYGDWGSRQRIFKKLAFSQVGDGLEQARREGGEVGRAAATLRRTVDKGMRDLISE